MRTMYKLLATTLSAATLAVSAPASAATLVVDVADIVSYNGVGDAGNTVLTYFIGSGATISAVSYDVTLAAISPSWLSEITVSFEDSAQTTGVYLTPGFADDSPGTASYAESASLVDLGLSFSVGADGILRLEFFEGFDDDVDFADGQWLSGTITLTHDGVETPLPAVPEPASWAMMIAGFGLVGGALRRRQSVAVTYA